MMTRCAALIAMLTMSTACSSTETGPCSQGIDEDTVVLLSFDEVSATGAIADETGAHLAEPVGSGFVLREGPEGCGQALDLSTEDATYAKLGNSADWDLASGSIDLWLQVDEASSTLAPLATRDAVRRNTPNHFGLYLTQSNRVVLRSQTTLIGDAAKCSARDVPLGAWVRIGVNFGPPQTELFVDGELATREDVVVVEHLSTNPAAYQCGADILNGVDGNDNPWLIGADGGQSPEGGGSPEEVLDWFRTGAIDQFRVSKVRRDYSLGPPGAEPALD